MSAVHRLARLAVARGVLRRPPRGFVSGPLGAGGMLLWPALDAARPCVPALWKRLNTSSSSIFSWCSVDEGARDSSRPGLKHHRIDCPPPSPHAAHAAFVDRKQPRARMAWPRTEILRRKARTPRRRPFLVSRASAERGRATIRPPRPVAASLRLPILDHGHCYFAPARFPESSTWPADRPAQRQIVAGARGECRP